VGIPVVMGAFGLSNLYDMAYGTKLTRVVKEAEHIMANERHRFVPPKQAPFNRFYTKAEKAAVADIKAVGEHIPAGLPHSRQKLRGVGCVDVVVVVNVFRPHV
jgi:DhnA family fructose-bisphosphate aldolase class Ia